MNTKVLLVWCIILIVIVLIVFGFAKMHKKKKEMYTKCEKTELFVIGDRGHRNRIYDCTGVGL